jgi:hypothetical protein
MDRELPCTELTTKADDARCQKKCTKVCTPYCVLALTKLWQVCTYQIKLKETGLGSDRAKLLLWFKRFLQQQTIYYNKQRACFHHKTNNCLEQGKIGEGIRDRGLLIFYILIIGDILITLIVIGFKK